MKNKEEPSVNLRRGNPCEQADLDRSDCVGPQTTGSLSRPGRTVAARTEQPALRCRSRSVAALNRIETNDPLEICSARQSVSVPLFVEPPDADPHVRWCGEGHQR
jgi:hypothetical protein